MQIWHVSRLLFPALFSCWALSGCAGIAASRPAGGRPGLVRPEAPGASAVERERPGGLRPSGETNPGGAAVVPDAPGELTRGRDEVSDEDVAAGRETPRETNVALEEERVVGGQPRAREPGQPRRGGPAGGRRSIAEEDGMTGSPRQEPAGRDVERARRVGRAGDDRPAQLVRHAPPEDSPQFALPPPWRPALSEEERLEGQVAPDPFANEPAGEPFRIPVRVRVCEPGYSTEWRPTLGE